MWVYKYKGFTFWEDAEESNIYHISKRVNGRLITHLKVECQTKEECKRIIQDMVK